MIYYYFACGGIFLLSLLLLSNATKVNTRANRWLGIFFLCAGGALLSWIAENTGMDKRYPLLVPVTELGRFVMAPALYLSVRYFTGAVPGRTVGWHFLPATLFPFILMGGSAYLPPFMGMVVGIGLRAQMLVYWLLSFRLLWKHQQRLGVSVRAQLNWLQWFLAGIGIMVLLWYNQVWKFSTVINLITGIGYCLALYLITYSLLQQQSPVTIADEKTAVSRVKPGELEELMRKLISIMQQEKLYRNSDLNLSQLAGKMEVSVHEVSWVLNKGYNKNFYQFVNHYRVEAAKELLHKEEYNHLSILGIAFEAGFNSKTTFNTAFKKITGMSPREYRQLQVRTDTDGH